MKDIPIIMSAPMVTATIREIEHPGEGKTETRRMAWREKVTPKNPAVVGSTTGRDRIASPWQHVQPGDRLWVRENWWIATKYSYGSTAGGSAISAPPLARRSRDPVRYAADGDPPNVGNKTYGPEGLRGGAFAAPDPYAVWIKWPSIHMPRWASRLTLVVTAVKIERLQKISEAGAIAEGSRTPLAELPVPARKAAWSERQAFSHIWDALHGAGAWDANPEVVALTFKPRLVNIDQMQAEAA